MPDYAVYSVQINLLQIYYFFPNYPFFDQKFKNSPIYFANKKTNLTFASPYRIEYKNKNRKLL